MVKVVDFKNVYIDSNSSYAYEELNEREYLIKVLYECSQNLGSKFIQYDFFIFSCHTNITPASATLVSLRPKILIYISDESSSDISCLADNFFLIFKSYINPNYFISTFNIYPFPLGYVNNFKANSSIPISKRKYNIFFSGNLNFNRLNFYKEVTWLSILPKFFYFKLMLHPFWKNQILKFVGTDFKSKTKNTFIKFSSSFKKGLEIDSYSNVLANSKIVLCPKGFTSSETFRLTEAMSCGCIVISETLPNLVFYEGSPIIQINSWKQGMKIATDLLKDPYKLEKLHRMSFNWWEKKLSNKSVADYISNKILFHEIDNSLN